MIRIERHPSRRQLAVFGLLWLMFFSFWAAASWWNSGFDWKTILYFALAIAVPAAGIIRFEILRIVYVLAATITFPIGMILSSVILVVIYYLVITPTGLILRLAGYDPMKRRFNRAAETYWSPRKQDAAAERYFKQF